ncbi:DUF1577 domain-containing protein [Leptospira wolffii]|uniref:DUF1577 domain-containing protein n=1 Tax=Leptospira wolffii TaxID=409998 RepID=UPI001083E216|nr:DUF1577 domain-containing protein [Leptospira wolffii]TGK59343.1 DUF1577 domain-containing protein [Leptospira wolffii]TGK71274.1 DUF1577 domain-containing protein [Leptospira wolffii]TGK77841.1 DUF1577 domain-containing protein [Leptospira wolffii]TGL29449.1 DUF1577 domain-containing protein [Leptospira wolffii]
MARIHFRIPISDESVYATNLRMSGESFESTDSEMPGIVHYTLEKFRSFLPRTPFANAEVGVFKTKLDPKFELVKQSGRTFFIEDTSLTEEYRSEDKRFINYENEISPDLSSAISSYKDQNVKTELIYPIVISNGRNEDISVGYIWVKNEEEGMRKHQLGTLNSLSENIAKEIRKWSDGKTSSRFKIMDLSMGGVRLRIHDDLLTEPLARDKEFVFDLVIRENFPTTIRSTLKWWSKGADGFLELGLEIHKILGEEPEENRFISNVSQLKDELRDSNSSEENETEAKKEPPYKKSGESVYQNNRILCIDSDSQSMTQTSETLSKAGYEVVSASTVAKALGLCLTTFPSLIVVDTHFVDVDGIKFLRALRKISPGSMFIVYSSREKKSERLVRYLSWIWAHLEKPDTDERLLESVKEAMDFHARRMSQFHLSTVSEEDLSGEIEWLLWKNYHRNSEQLSLGKNILDNVTHSTAQGLGLSSLLIQLDLAEYSMKMDGEECLIPMQVLDSILENKNVLRDWTEKLAKLRILFNLKISKEPISSGTISGKISETIQDLEEIAKIKNNRIVFTDRISGNTVLSNLDFFDFALRELLINAMKFSPQNSKINVLVHSKVHSLCVSVLNEIAQNEGGITGIPDKLSSQIFEPFSRLNNNYDERFFAVDFGLGIGLHLADHLAVQAGAKLEIKEVTDYSEEIGAKKVSAEISLPLFTVSTNREYNVSNVRTSEISR